MMRLRLTRKKAPPLVDLCKINFSFGIVPFADAMAIHPSVNKNGVPQLPPRSPKLTVDMYLPDAGQIISFSYQSFQGERYFNLKNVTPVVARRLAQNGIILRAWSQFEKLTSEKWMPKMGIG